MLLDAEPGLEVVAEAGNVDDAIRYLRGHRPEVLILDLNMPGRSSLDAIPDIAEASPETRTVVLTMQSEPAFARRALEAGVLGYILKEAADAELVKAVRMAAEGRRYLQPDVATLLATDSRDSADKLSEREREILTLIGFGHTNIEIAERASISVRTVESHRSHILQKLHLTKRSELVRYALEHGMLETDGSQA